jgi:TonB-linked SusC/RagA family outer membrane protein
MRKIAALVFLFCSLVQAIAQTQSISGVVVSSEDGEPVAGAAVTVEGYPGIGVITGADGRFVFPNVPAPARQLRFSFIGMKEVTAPIRPVMHLTMEPLAQEIGEVVVMGMSKIDKRLFTGATDRLESGRVLLDGVADLSRSLEGRSAGVSVQNVSGAFGAAPKIRVRGATSIYGNSRPLWVVDGVVLEDIVNVGSDQLSSGDAVTLISSAVAGLNPDDIESFQILKDGSATSIYGARAMAGVVVVTTKRGHAGAASVSYTGELTTRLAPRYAEFNIMNSQEQMDVYQDMYNKGYLRFSETYRAASSGVYGKMYALIDAYDRTDGSFGLANTEQARNEYLRAAERRNTDWFSRLFSASLMQNHALSLSSGNDKSRHYTSLSLMHDPGWAKASAVSRYTLNTNASYSLRERLTLHFIGNASYRRQKAPGTSEQNVNDLYATVSRDFDINPFSYALNTSRTLSPDEFYTRNWAPFNILYELDNNYMDIEVADLKMQGELRWNLAAGFDLAALAALRYSVSNQDHNIKDYSNQAQTYRAAGDATIRDRNNWLYTDPDEINSVPQVVLPEGGILDKRVYKMFAGDFRATADFNRTFAGVHIINLFAGMEVSSADRSHSYNRGWGYQFDKGGTPFYDYLIFKQGLEQNRKYYSHTNTYLRNAAFFGNLTYSWKHRYTLMGSLRYEGTNSLGRSRSARWLPTWNVSAAWNAHEERFVPEAIRRIVSHARFRLSYSLTADRGPENITNSQAVYLNETAWRPSAGLQESYIRIAELENSELTYEKKREWNAGLDLGFLHNRINLSADLYTRNNFDLIGEIDTQGAGGQITKFANVASMRSQGVEFTLSTHNVRSARFSWDTDFTFSWAENEITRLDSKAKAFQLITGAGYAREGYPVRALFSYDFRGLDEDGMPTFVNEKGEVTVSDINFQENLNLGHLVYEGPTDPTLTGGFGNTLVYRHLRLNLFATYSFGNKVRLDPFFASSYSDLSAMPREFKNRWMSAGDELLTNIPAIASVRQAADRDLRKAYSAYNYSTVRTASGGFARMKEISLTYDFPTGLAARCALAKLQLKLQAANLFLLYADSRLNGQDPEFFGAGGVAVPMPKQFTLSLRAGF